MEIVKRPASILDADLLLEWRNADSVRKFSKNPKRISKLEHLKWCRSRIQRQLTEPFWIFEKQGEMLGTSRSDLSKQNLESWQISILVAPEFRNLGIGVEILYITCEDFFKIYPNKKIIAIVHIDNINSHKIFRDANFKLKSKNGLFFSYEKCNLE